MDAKKAMEKLSEVIKNDPDYAWAWHCNVAMSAFDEGLCKPAANRAAGRFMAIAFKVDTTKHEHFPETQEDNE